MRLRELAAPLVAVAVVVSGCVDSAPERVLDARSRFEARIDLPEPVVSGSRSLEEAIAGRRSTREWAEVEVPLDLVGQLLWAAQGVTSADGKRASPSAGGRYPLELFVVTDDELMHYLPDGHRVELRPDVDRRPELVSAAFGQEHVGAAPAVIVVAAVFERTRVEYGAVAPDLVNRESGHAVQNLLLQATALGMAAVPIGGFNSADVGRILALPPDHEVLYLVPVGFPAGER